MKETNRKQINIERFETYIFTGSSDSFSYREPNELCLSFNSSWAESVNVSIFYNESMSLYVAIKYSDRVLFEIEERYDNISPTSQIIIDCMYDMCRIGGHNHNNELLGSSDEIMLIDFMSRFLMRCGKAYKDSKFQINDARFETVYKSSTSTVDNNFSMVQSYSPATLKIDFSVYGRDMSLSEHSITSLGQGLNTIIKLDNTYLTKKLFKMINNTIFNEILHSNGKDSQELLSSIFHLAIFYYDEYQFGYEPYLKKKI